jgi:hypothetical protein
LFKFIFLSFKFYILKADIVCTGTKAGDLASTSTTFQPTKKEPLLDRESPQQKGSGRESTPLERVEGGSSCVFRASIRQIFRTSVVSLTSSLRYFYLPFLCDFIALFEYKTALRVKS